VASRNSSSCGYAAVGSVEPETLQTGQSPDSWRAGADHAHSGKSRDCRSWHQAVRVRRAEEIRCQHHVALVGAQSRQCLVVADLALRQR